MHIDFARHLEREVEEWKSYYQNTHAEFFKQQQALAAAEAKVRELERTSGSLAHKVLMAREERDTAEARAEQAERELTIVDDQREAYKVEGVALKAELDTAHARIAELEKERDELREIQNRALVHLKEFISGGVDPEDIVTACEQLMAADAEIPEGEYEGADELSDVVRWLFSERSELRERHEAEVGRLREALELKKGK